MIWEHCSNKCCCRQGPKGDKGYKGEPVSGRPDDINNNNSICTSFLFNLKPTSCNAASNNTRHNMYLLTACAHNAWHFFPHGTVLRRACCLFTNKRSHSEQVVRNLKCYSRKCNRRLQLPTVSIINHDKHVDTRV